MAEQEPADLDTEEAPAQEGPEVLETGLKLSLAPATVEELWALEDPLDQAKALAKLSLPGLDDPHTFRAEVINDFYLFNLVHAKSLCLTARQAAVFHAMMEEVLLSIGPKGGSVTPEQCFESFRTLIINHAMDQPPDRLAIFAGSEARLLTDFATTTIFRHFSLYRYVMEKEREVEWLQLSISVDQPLAPPDLNGATLTKPKERRRTSASGQATSEEGADEAKAGTEGAEDPAEEDEIEGLVRRKLEETKQKLEAKLKEREEAFNQKLASMGGKKK